MKVLNLELHYSAHSKQQQFHDDDSQFRAFIGGVGSGKTIAGCIETLLFCIRNPGCLFVIATPTYPMLRDTTLREFFKWCPKELIKSYNRGENILKLINGSEILGRSLDDPRTIDRIRGLTIAGFWIDEGSMSPELAWKVLLARLRQKPYELRGWITTTPRGFNWIYDKFVKDKRENYSMVTCSSRDNPYLTKEYIAELEANYSGVFARQEIEGQFVGFEGLVYSDFDRRQHVKDIDKTNLNKFIAGVDWGYTNPSVILVIGIDYDNRYYVIEEFYERKILIEDLIGIAKSLRDKYDISMFYCDPSEPQFIYQFRDKGLNAVGGDNEIRPGINAVSTKLRIRGDGQPALFVNTICRNTVTEFENYRYPEGTSEKPTQENPIKLYDHALDALRYAMIGAEKFTSWSPTIV